MRVIIAGGRDFDDYEKLKAYCDIILVNIDQPEIVSGTARGADQLGERYAKEKSYKVTKFPADWDKYGKSAGYLRNTQMADYADGLIAFWDGSSRGTKHMIDIAKEKGLKVAIRPYKKMKYTPIAPISLTDWGAPSDIREREMAPGEVYVIEKIHNCILTSDRTIRDIHMVHEDDLNNDEDNFFYPKTYYVPIELFQFFKKID